MKKNIVHIVTIGLLAFVVQGLSAADTDSPLSVSEYTFGRPARELHVEQNRVQLVAPGKVSFTSPIGIRGLKGTLTGRVNANTPTPWIERNDGIPVWKGRLTPDKPQELNLEFSKSDTLSVFLQGQPGGIVILSDAMVVLADGREIPLTKAFQPGYEKLPRTLGMEAFPEPPTVMLDSVEAKRLIERDWAMQLVHRAFQQDGFETQDDRLPRDADGNILPSIYFENGKMHYRIPEPKK